MTRKFAQRFFERVGKMPNMAQAADYSSTMMYLEAVKAADLPAGMPDGMALAGAFKLDLGDRKLDTPIQLAIPTTGIAAGTKVVFMRYAEIPMPDGSKQPIWLQEETGVHVHADLVLGLPGEIVSHLRELEAVGATNILLVDPNASLANLRAFAREVMPALQSDRSIAVR